MAGLKRQFCFPLAITNHRPQKTEGSNPGAVMVQSFWPFVVGRRIGNNLHSEARQYNDHHSIDTQLTSTILPNNAERLGVESMNRNRYLRLCCSLTSCRREELGSDEAGELPQSGRFADVPELSLFRHRTRSFSRSAHLKAIAQKGGRGPSSVNRMSASIDGTSMAPPGMLLEHQPASWYAWTKTIDFVNSTMRITMQILSR